MLPIKNNRCLCTFLAKAVLLWKNWSEEGKFAFLLYIRARKNWLSLAAFLLGLPIPADLWAGHRSQSRKQHCSSASLNHLVSMWSLTSLSTTLTVTLEKTALEIHRLQLNQCCNSHRALSTETRMTVFLWKFVTFYSPDQKIKPSYVPNSP